jgi:hypothetical protein
MGRKRKKAPPVADALPLNFDISELSQRAEMVAHFWQKAGDSAPALTDRQLDALVLEISACGAQPIDAKGEKLKTTARSAIKSLLAWCRYNPNDNDLPHVIFSRKKQLLQLEVALLAAQHLAAVQARAWLTPAWQIWALTSRISGTPSINAKSHAVVFTSKALKWAGHPTANPGAISQELRKNPKFRERMLA